MVEQIQEQKRPAVWTRLVARYSPGFKFGVFRILSRLAGTLPLRVTYTVAVLVGDAIYYCSHEHSANAVSNMRRVLGPRAGERTIRRAARASFRNYTKTLADFARFPYMQASEIDRRVVQHYGLEVMEQAQAQNKGVIAVSGHIGNWDFAGAFMGRHGVPMYALADKFEPPQLDELVIQTRLRNGIHIIKMEAMAMRTIFEVIKRKEIVLLLVDRPMPNEGVQVQFFGETAWLPSGPAAIALRTRAPIVIGYCIRERGDTTFTGGIAPALEYQHLITGNKQADIQAITQAIATALEALIRRYPTQWYMFRPMWPRPATAAEARRARRQARRQARGPRARRLYHARQSISRLRSRIRGGPPAENASGMALGISVDPPDVEEWIGTRGPQEP
ncbi:MAG TPA: hypothetical protein VKY74_09780 [Chloroflexia bacterium]|nr:hypothetical protein [Chloroflexia bacterium]